ncbi:condensation domain-containing protein, partial [Flavobacterium sp. ZB4P13]|uniref:condensation domain-containing protein n=1 Tax=Flavobacterium sp. ZB4P13 TaxID=3401728 RepID=UPI003AAB76A1
GGSGLARGYLNRAELTVEKFVDNPFKEGERIYKTGDLGRWLPDGNIEYLGRIDDQVKIRGYRIELGEIQSTLFQYSESIRQVVVDVKEINNEKVIVAYYVSEAEIDKSELRGYLVKNLPEYMVPSFYVELDSMPLTSNGKVDRKALPSVTGEDVIKKEYVAPRNATEQKMVEIWQEVLGVKRVGITDTFFELGGHSLLAFQLFNRINKELGRKVNFGLFFENPTIKDLCTHLQESEYVAIPNALESESYPLTASQNRMWILNQSDSSSSTYNMSTLIKFKGYIDVLKFEEAFILLIHRHEILRTFFKINKEGDIRQYIMPQDQINFTILKLDYSFLENKEDKALDYLKMKDVETFDLGKGPLLHSTIIKLEQESILFYLSIHHIIGDGWSMELLRSEVVKIYNALIYNQKINLPDLKLQYKDYAAWLNEENQKEKFILAEKYWLKQFTGELPVLDLPSFKTRPLIKTHNGASFNHEFSKEFLEILKMFSNEQGITLFMTLMAGINILLHIYTNQDDIIIGTPIAGRGHPDLENQIGLYMNTLAIRTKFEEGDTFLNFVMKQKEILLGAYEHQIYPFDSLIDKLNLKRDRSRSVLFDVLIILQSQVDMHNVSDNGSLLGLTVEGYGLELKTSKFDIEFEFTETLRGLSFRIVYNTDIYDSYLIERIFPHFENLLTKFINEPKTSIE